MGGRGRGSGCVEEGCECLSLLFLLEDEGSLDNNSLAGLSEFVDGVGYA